MYQHLFHLARKDGGFTFYSTPHRLAALYYLDFGFVVLLLTSSAAACILLLLLPALRHRLATFALSFSALWTGAAIGYCLLIPEWQVGSLRLPSGTSLTYRSTINVTSSYSLGLGVGLRAANITLYAYDVPDIYYDETINLEDTLAGMRRQYHDALVRGLPAPILSVFEQVGASGDLGFSWPFYIRLAGYYCSWMLKFAIVLWLYAIVLHCSVPEKSADMFLAASLVCLCTPAVYFAIVNDAKSNIYVNGIPLVLRYGACFWTCITTGVFASAVGSSLAVLGRWRPKKVHTTFSMEEWIRSQRLLPQISVPGVATEIEMNQLKSISHTQ